MRRTKIVCTIGPASREHSVLEAMIRAGMDVARLNMSHGTREEHAEVIARIRATAARVGRTVAILQDLSGPKIRLGKLKEPVFLRQDETVTLTVEQLIGEGHVLPVNYPDFIGELQVGHRLSMADGLILLRIESIEGTSATARVLSSGTISSHKGLNLPDGGDAIPALTEKDAEDLRFGLRQGVDWMALSFVRSAADADVPRAIMKAEGVHVPLLAKIEKLRALENLESIVATFDGLMVARGDLGVEAPLEDIPAIQKMTIAAANRAAKPVITATQMLLSMVSSPRPTRAEVTDVANAILDGTDAVMLSEETAQGSDPANVVATMGTIADSAEQLYREGDRRRSITGPNQRVPEAITRAACVVAQEVGAKLIITPTDGGSTARLMASTRPNAPILAISPRETTVRQLCLTWGVVSYRIKPIGTTEMLVEACRHKAIDSGLARPGDRVVVTAGLPLNQPGTTNVLEVLEL